jgi:hypothetical protein
VDGSTTPSDQPEQGAAPTVRAEPQPQPPQDNSPEERQRYLCEMMRRNDAVTCANMAAKFGEEAGTACSDSAVARFAQCTSGNPGAGLPPLALRYQ